jgi:hypothetical protein
LVVGTSEVVTSFTFPLDAEASAAATLVDEGHLADWMDITVTPLEPHPDDPAATVANHSLADRSQP